MKNVQILLIKEKKQKSSIYKLITKFKIYESKEEETKNILDTLLKHKSYAPDHDDVMGWTSKIQPLFIEDSDDYEAKKLLKGIREYIRWKYFGEDDGVMIDGLFIPQLYDDLTVYKDPKKLISIHFHTGHFASSRHIMTKKEFPEFIEFIKNPDVFITQDKYNL